MIFASEALQVKPLLEGLGVELGLCIRDRITGAGKGLKKLER
jgi:hypothetical protein